MQKIHEIIYKTQKILCLFFEERNMKITINGKNSTTSKNTPDRIKKKTRMILYDYANPEMIKKEKGILDNYEEKLYQLLNR